MKLKREKEVITNILALVRIGSPRNDELQMEKITRSGTHECLSVFL